MLLCLRVTSTIQLIDPLTLQLREVMGSAYWLDPFTPILESKRLVTFTVMEKEELGHGDRNQKSDGNYPDAILVRKIFAKRERRTEKRKWKLKRIIESKHIDDDDLLRFQEELEEDDEARKNVNIYRDVDKNLDSDYEDDIPRIDLSEMMEMVDLNKKDIEMEDNE